MNNIPRQRKLLSPSVSCYHNKSNKAHFQSWRIFVELFSRQRNILMMIDSCYKVFVPSRFTVTMLLRSVEVRWPQTTLWTLNVQTCWRVKLLQVAFVKIDAFWQLPQFCDKILYVSDGQIVGGCVQLKVRIWGSASSSRTFMGGEGGTKNLFWSV